MKRILPIAMTLAFLICGMTAGAAHAEDETPAPQQTQTEAEPVETETASDAVETVQLSVGTVTGGEGDEVEVPVTIDNCAGVDSAQFDLNYDPSAVEIVAAVPGTVFPAEYCVTNINEAGRVRVAAISGIDGLTAGGEMLLLRCKLKSGTGSAVTISEGKVTRVDAEYVQSSAYVTIADGGIQGAGAMPAPLVTPWIPETPAPTPSPTPEPTAVPVFAAVTERIESTPLPDGAAPAEPQSGAPVLAFVIVGILIALIVAGIVIVLTASRNQKRRRKRRRRKKSGSTRSV